MYMHLMPDFSSTVEVRGIKFQESGPQIVPDTKAKVLINCSHDDNSRPVMLWYQQKGQSAALVLLGYNYGATTSNYEDGVEEQFEIQMPDRQNGALVVREASSSHTAVYFCAVSEHGDVVWDCACTQTPPPPPSSDWMMNSIQEDRQSLNEADVF